MSKYEPLGQFLNGSRLNELPMSFAEIERILGFPLPAKSRNNRAWWSNNPDNSVMTKVWLAAGFRTEQVDIASGKLVFRRVGRRAGGTEESVFPGAAELKPRRHPGFGLMKGLTTILPGTDLTAPTGEDWGQSE